MPRISSSQDVTWKVGTTAAVVITEGKGETPTEQLPKLAVDQGVKIAAESKSVTPTEQVSAPVVRRPPATTASETTEARPQERHTFPGLGGPPPPPPPPRTITTSVPQLQSKFKHAADFGVTGTPTKAGVAAFDKAVTEHVTDPTKSTQIVGTYRRQPAIHYVNPTTGLNVITTPTGQFWVGWKLNPAQLHNVLTRGSL